MATTEPHGSRVWGCSLATELSPADSRQCSSPAGLYGGRSPFFDAFVDTEEGPSGGTMLPAFGDAAAPKVSSATSYDYCLSSSSRAS